MVRSGAGTSVPSANAVWTLFTSSQTLTVLDTAVVDEQGDAAVVLAVAAQGSQEDKEGRQGELPEDSERGWRHWHEVTPGLVGEEGLEMAN